MDHYCDVACCIVSVLVIMCGMLSAYGIDNQLSVSGVNNVTVNVNVTEEGRDFRKIDYPIYLPHSPLVKCSFL